MNALIIYTAAASLQIWFYLFLYNLLIGAKQYNPNGTDWNRWGLTMLLGYVVLPTMIFPAGYLFFEIDNVRAVATLGAFIICAIVILTSSSLGIAAAYYYCIERRRECGVVLSTGFFAYAIFHVIAVIITTVLLFLR
ncbi:MAG: hypothetical protein IKC75_05490 [Clostridia bacterium]|nr:hypothetical protein [Clostridia bacterium]